MHLISEFVIALLQTLDVPESQIDELVAKLEFCKQVPESSTNTTMVQLCEIAHKIIAPSARKPIEEEENEKEVFSSATTHTNEQVRL